MPDLSPRDRADRTYSEVLRKLPHGSATKLAKEMGITDKDFSSLKNDQLAPVLYLLAHLGMKCVPITFHCLAPDDFRYLTNLEARISRNHAHLKWEESAIGEATAPGALDG